MAEADPSTDVAVTIVAHDVEGAGGMERQLRTLITGLLGREIRVVVVSRTLGLAPHPLLRWRRVPGPARPFVLAYPWFAVAGSVLLARSRCGITHTTGAIVVNRADVCTVHYLHNGVARAVRRMQRASRLYRLNASLGAVMSRVAERFVYSSPARSRALVAVSAALAEDMLETFPSRSDAIWLIEHGVDTERFRPDELERREIRDALGIDRPARLALFIGSEWSMKGVDIAVEALATAPSWHLAVVGSGDAESMRKMASGLGVESRLHLVGESPEPERYCAAADAFVLPSAYESFSLAAFEAAASGVPVIATDVGAIAEIVNAGGGTFIDRTAASLGEALNHLEADREAAVAMSQRAREASMRFTWEEATGKYIDLYRRESVEATSPLRSTAT